MAGLVKHNNTYDLSYKVKKFTTVLDVDELKNWIEERKKKPGVRMSVSSLFEAMSYSKSYASRLCKDKDEHRIEISARFIAMLLITTGEDFQRFFRFVPVRNDDHEHPQDRYHHWHKCVRAGVDILNDPVGTAKPKFGDFWPPEDKETYVKATNHRRYDDSKLPYSQNGL